jgi:hypothetical protein
MQTEWATSQHSYLILGLVTTTNLMLVANLMF